MKIRMRNGKTYRVSRSQGIALVAARLGTEVQNQPVEAVALPSKRAVLRRQDPEPEAVSESIPESTADLPVEQTDDDESVEISARTGKPKRKYRRRDLVAETT